MAEQAASSQYYIVLFYYKLTDSSADKERPLAGAVLCFTSIVPEQRVSSHLIPAT